MKIAFDVHGTIKESPEIFKPMMKMFVESGHEVVIISGPPLEEIYKEVSNLGYKDPTHYSEICSVVAYISICTDVVMTQDENGNWWCDEGIWWDVKGDICSKYEIDMIIDNDLRYKPNMPALTKFIHWDEKFKEDLNGTH